MNLIFKLSYWVHGSGNDLNFGNNKKKRINSQNTWHWFLLQNIQWQGNPLAVGNSIRKK